MNKKATMATILILTTAMMPRYSFSETGNTPEVFMDLTTESLQPQCVEWQLKGICFWMTCTIFGCSFATSLKTSNWNPDLAIQVYSKIEDAPLGYTQLPQEGFKAVGESMLDVLGLNFGSLESSSTGSVKTAGGANASSTLRFYDTTVVGNPGLMAYNSVFGSLYGSMGWCTSPAMPLNIYYDSLLDSLEWRYGIWEAWNSLTRIPEFLGPYGFDHYGELYPRVGAVNQSSPYKAASALAYRAAHIVKEDPASHATLGVLSKFSSTNYSWPRPPMSNTHSRWSNVKPHATAQCQPLSSQTQHSLEESTIHSETENYLKIEWGQDTCCYRRGSTLLSG